MCHLFASLAHFERELIRERTMAGLAAARRRGRVGGRKTVLTPANEKQARKMLAEGAATDEIATVLGVGVSTLYPRLGVRVGGSVLNPRVAPSVGVVGGV